jgi:hypothetical protein
MKVVLDTDVLISGIRVLRPKVFVDKFLRSVISPNATQRAASPRYSSDEARDTTVWTSVI